MHPPSHVHDVHARLLAGPQPHPLPALALPCARCAAAATAASVAELTSGMGEEHYSTKTRGERTQGAARDLGKAAYIIAK